MQTSIKKTIQSYTAVFEPANEGGYVVYVPALAGCATQGETFEEAQANVQDAIEGYLQTLRDLHEDIPREAEGTIVTRVKTSV